MTEDTPPERIPFEEHPLYELYQADRQQWNLFMKEYLNEDKITEISKRNPIIKDDFKAVSTLNRKQKNTFHLYMDSAPNKQERGLRELFYHLDFKNYIFNENVEFTNYLFPNAISFTNAKFLFMADFQRAEFSDWTDFQSTQFSDRANFQSAQFSDKANFQRAQFSEWANFQSAQFSDKANFQRAQFSQMANFEGAQFSERANFIKATFEEQIYSSNATFKSKTDFTGAIFKKFAPQFYEATLHQNTTFDYAAWPDNSKIQDAERLLANQSAYNRLVLEMNKQLRHEQELKFFAKELEAQRHIHWHKKQLTSWLLNYFYYITSYYGRSIRQPVILIFLLFIAILSVNFYTYNDTLILNEGARETVLRYTFLDFLPGGPLLQQRAVTSLFKPELQPPPLWLDMVNSFASVVILAGFFLLGLGLRNRFRIR